MSKTEKHEQFTITNARPTIQLFLNDGRVLEGPRGATLEEFFQTIQPDASGAPIVAALVNHELRELTYPLEMDAHIHPLTVGDEDGARVYRRSLTFLMEAAFGELFPEAALTIDHSVAAGGYFCQVAGRGELTSNEIASLEARMRELVTEDIRLGKSHVPIQEVIDYMASKGYDDKVRLLAHRKKDYLVLYEMNDHRDYHHGYMVPSTGYLRWFALAKVEGGFTLRFPRRRAPTVLSAPPSYPKMLEQFRVYGNLLNTLGIGSVGALNDAVQNDRIREVILVSEALHTQRLSEIATKIAAERERIKVILIAGPSSSGKTTSSRRLTIQLLARGISPVPLEMDNYFVDRDKTPRDENGEYDFEHVNALNRTQLAEDLQRLIAGERVQLPKYDFLTGTTGPGEHVQIQPGQMLILEGIHGLNPDLIPGFPQEKTFRIYISALTQLNLDRHNRVSTTDTRLLRRIVRDASYRGYSAQTTLQRWESVTRGEKRNIFPYQENADIMFNSALVYEISALKPYAEPMLRQVAHGTHEFVEAKRLLALLEWFLPVGDEMIPDNSLLREFLGRSIFERFRVWEKINGLQ